MSVRSMLMVCCLLLLAAPATGQRRPEPPPATNPNVQQDETFVAAYRAMGHPRMLIQTIVAGPPANAQVNERRIDQAADFDSRLKGVLLARGHVDLIPTGPAMYALHGTPPVLPGEVMVAQEQWTAWWGHFHERGQATLISITPQDRSELKILESLPLDDPMRAAKELGSAEDADIVIVIRLLDTPQRRGTPMQATYAMVDLARNRLIGSHSWEVRPGRTNTPWTTVHANALAGRIMRDFSALDPSGGRGCRLVLQVPVGQLQPAALRDALRQVSGVTPDSIHVRFKRQGDDLATFTVAFDYTGDVTELHEQLDAQLEKLGLGASEIHSAQDGRLELQIKPPAPIEPVQLVIDGRLSTEQLQTLKQELSQIAGIDPSSIDLAGETLDSQQYRYEMTFVFRGSLLTLRNEVVQIFDAISEDRVAVISADAGRLNIRLVTAPVLDPYYLTIHGRLPDGALANLAKRIGELNGVNGASVQLVRETATSNEMPERTISFKHLGNLIDLRESINKLVQAETEQPVLVESVQPEGMVLRISPAPVLERLVVLLQGPLGAKPLMELRDDIAAIHGVHPTSVRLLEERMIEGQPVLVIELAYDSDLVKLRDQVLSAVSHFTTQPTIVLSSDRELLTLLVGHIPDEDHLTVQISGVYQAGSVAPLTKAIGACPGVAPDSVEILSEESFTNGDRLELSLIRTEGLATVRDAILSVLKAQTGGHVDVLTAAPGRLVFSISEGGSSNGLVVNNNHAATETVTPQPVRQAVPDYSRMQQAVGLVVVRPENSPAGIALDDILSLGTAFMMFDGGQMITSRHVVTEDGSTDYRYDVLFDGGARAKANVSYISDDLDYAILTIEVDGIEPLTTSQQVHPGDPVFVYGFPSAAGHWAAAVDLSGSGTEPTGLTRHHRVLNVTSGTISAIHDTHGPFGRLIQCNATVYPGNSGGPLVNQEGQVIGVMSVRAFDPDDPSNQLESINGAISMDAILEDLRQARTATQP